MNDLPSCLLRPALACRRPAASARARSRSISFSRCSYCRAVRAASAFAFLERPEKLPSSPSSSDSSSLVALRESESPGSDTRRARFTSCFALNRRQFSSSRSHVRLHSLFTTLVSASLASTPTGFASALLNGSLYLLGFFVVFSAPNCPSSFTRYRVDTPSGNFAPLLSCLLVALAAETFLADF
jgi:hypothetical protein